MTPTETKLAALDKIIAAVRAYLPPDGMPAEELINAVIEAVDNGEFNKAIDAPASCPSCNGTGDLGGNPSYGMCPDCDGRGQA